MDALFLKPFLTGLLLAPPAAVLGAYLRLRGEWLAAFAYAQVAAAGGVVGAVLGLPVTAAAVTAALLAGGGKGLAARAGNDLYALLILLAWGVALVVAANSPLGEIAGKALFDGQIYFTGDAHLVMALAVALACAALLPWLSPRLLRARFFPDHERANGVAPWRHGLPFDLLVVCTVALATAAMGVMAAFALVFVPAWIAWRLAAGWRSALWLVAGIAVTAHVTAFVTALLFDQPYAPLLVLILWAMSMTRWFVRTRKDDRDGTDLG